MMCNFVKTHAYFNNGSVNPSMLNLYNFYVLKFHPIVIAFVLYCVFVLRRAWFRVRAAQTERLSWGQMLIKKDDEKKTPCKAY